MVYPYTGRHVVRISYHMLFDTMDPCPGPHVVRTSDILFLDVENLEHFVSNLVGFRRVSWCKDRQPIHTVRGFSLLVLR